MAHASRGLSRRRVLAGGVVGGAVLVVRPSTLLAGPATGGRQAQAPAAFGTVAEPGSSDGPVWVQVGSELIEVQPVGFPEGWELLAGDRLVVDLEQQTFWPHLEYVPSGDPKAPVFTTVNEDPALNRVFSS